MASSVKASKKMRRVSAFNVFQQCRMRGKSVRVGTPQYKSLLQRVKQEWDTLGGEQRAEYEARAHEQNLARAAESRQTLRDAECQDGPSSDVLSSSQRKRLGQVQLNQSLQALAKHEVWNTGLGIGDHVSALKPSLVQSVDPESSVMTAFDYLPVAAPNPAEMPHIFCSCAELHPGVCKGETGLFAEVVTMVQQFQRCLEVHKIQGVSLFSLQLDSSSLPSSSSPSGDILEPLWLLMGCVSKRPLSHVMGRLVAHRHVADVLTPAVADSLWQLQTLHGILREISKKVLAQGAELRELRIKCRYHSFDTVGSNDAPNHFRSRSTLATFEIGPEEAFVAKPSRQVVRSFMPLGISLSLEKASGRGRGRGRGSGREATSKPKSSEKTDKSVPSVSVAAETAGEPQEDSSPEDGEPPIAGAAEFALQRMQKHDATPLAVEHLSAELEQEVAAAAWTVANQQGDMDADDRDEPNVHSEIAQLAQARHRDADASAASSSTGGAQAVATAGRGELPFNTRLGLTGCSILQRRTGCYVCKQVINKGDYRMEYAFAAKKPPRSLHPECASGIAAETFAASLDWLSTELGEPGLGPERASVLQHVRSRILRCQCTSD